MANRKGEIHLDMENSEEKPATASVQRSISIGIVQHRKKKSDRWTKPRNNIVVHEQNHAKTNNFFPKWNTVFLVSCVLAVSLDPLFFYIPIINEDMKCLKMDKRLKAVSLALRSLTDLFYIADLMHRILAITKSVNSRRTLQIYILLDILAVLPFPQVVIFIFFPKMRVSRLLKTRKFLNSLVFLQYMPRSLLIYRLCYEHKKAPKTTSIWVKSFFNLFLYILASHVIGAFWYYFSIQREIACWEYACRSENGCEPSTFSCDDPSLRNIKILNELCPINPPNKAIFDFGIFTDALQSGVLQTTNFPMKFLNCFWWGLQNLSSLGQNLQTSNYPWENLFAVFISISGLLLFLYLMGNLQTYMLLSTAASEKQKLEFEEKLRRDMKLKGLDVELWLSRNRLPNTMKRRIMENVHRELGKNKNVNVEILSVLPPDYLSYVKRCLCLATLRKVPKLKDIKGLEELKGICEHFKPVIYAQDSFIIREGERPDQILLVTQGTLRSYTTSNGGKKDPTTPKHINQGDYYGEELISWASKFPPSTELPPISDKNVRSITRVEAFALTAEDLKNHVVFRYWWQFSKGIDLNKLTDSQMEQLRKLAVIHSQRAFRRRKRAEKPAALPTKTQSMSVVPIL